MILGGLVPYSKSCDRRLGAYVTSEPLRVASEIGYKVGILQSSEDGHPVYVNLGFRDVGAIYAYFILG